MGSWPAAPSPYTSSVETCTNRRMPCTLALSKSTCVPKMLFCVKEKELPKLLSTWVCAARCTIVSISSSSNTKLTKSEEQMLPFTNLKFLRRVTSARFSNEAQSMLMLLTVLHERWWYDFQLNDMLSVIRHSRHLCDSNFRVIQ